MNDVTNGTHSQANGSSATDATVSLEPSQLIYALQVIYDPRTSNAIRKDATAYLERAKIHPNAPSQGFLLASDKNQSAPSRHFGLSLLEYTIRYQWEGFSTEQTQQLREWIVQLAEDVAEWEPLYFRNKIAQLWVDIAERSWIDDWHDMDEALVKLWNGSTAQQELVLHVLETLSEVVFSQEATNITTGNLGKACVEIFLPSILLARALPERDFGYIKRCGDEGWLTRLVSLLSRCIEQDIPNQAQIKARTIKILRVLQSLMPWILLQAVAQSGCLDLLCKCLEIPDIAVQMGAIETMHTLYHRAPFSDEDVVKLVCPLMTRDGIALLTTTMSNTNVDCENIDEDRYSTLKKLSEVVCALTTFLEQRPHLIGERTNVPAFLQFLLNVLQHPSLVVSIPILYIWTKLLAVSALTKSELFMPVIGPLLETCTTRLLRYEALPPDSEDPTFIFLHEDFDTMPERHAFIGNYRRFCTDVIDRIVRKSPFEAIRHLLAGADNVFFTLYDAQRPFSPQQFSSNSTEVLRVDAQCTVVLTALKSYMTWSASSRKKGKFPEEENQTLTANLEEWCRRLMGTTFEDPVIAKRILQLMVELALNLLPATSSICLSICEYIFKRRESPTQIKPTFDEAVKEFQAVQPRELQLLAGAFSDQFLAVLPELEAKIGSIVQDNNMEQRIKLDYKAFLFTVVLRATQIDENERKRRLRSMLQPVIDSWLNPDLQGLLGDFESFRAWLRLDQACDVFLENKADKVDDWSISGLDAQGMEAKDNVANGVQDTPLHATRSLLFASMDRGRPGAEMTDMSRELWRDAASVILPRLLQCISNAHAFNNPDNWSSYPPEMRIILNRILVDRVWQSGISAESKDDFYSRVRNSKNSLEGLASATRGAVRGVREVSYWILHCMSGLGDVFFGHEGLPEVLARTLYTDAHMLSTHQLSALLKLSAALIDGCPGNLRSRFMPPVIIALFKQLDVKLGAEWAATEQRNDAKGEDDDLDQEMKAESVLRALTYSAVTLASSLLGHEQQRPSEIQRQDGMDSETQSNETQASIRELCLSSPEMLEALMVFCTHALRMRDSRCCGLVTRILRSVIPEFVDDKGTIKSGPLTLLHPPTFAPQIREFFSNTVLTTTITSLHEPYFVDLQKDLAALIGAILALYYPATTTSRDILLSLPGMFPPKVDSGLAEIKAAPSERAQRAWVLKLLESVRGVGLHEWGKIETAGKGRGGRRERSKMQEAFMVVDDPVGMIRRGGSPELAGVAELFG